MYQGAVDAGYQFGPGLPFNRGESPMEPLQTIIDEIGVQHPRRLTEAPRMVDLQGFGHFLQNLKNQGMQPHLMGDFPASDRQGQAQASPRKPYLVKK